MLEDQKFYVTASRILDAEVVGDVEYLEVGSRTGSNVFGADGNLTPQLRDRSEFRLFFKDSEKDGIFLYGEAADTAWMNYRKAAGPTNVRLAVVWEKI